jgi:hypothetical protein
MALKILHMLMRKSLRLVLKAPTITNGKVEPSTDRQPMEHLSQDCPPICKSLTIGKVPKGTHLLNNKVRDRLSRQLIPEKHRLLSYEFEV